MCWIFLLIFFNINIGWVMLVRLLFLFCLVFWLGVSLMVGVNNVILIVKLSVFVILLFVLLVIFMVRVCCFFGIFVGQV